MNLTKKQVKMLLDIISSDTARPIITHAKIDTYEGHPVLVGTDGYVLTALRLTDDVLPIMGKLIPRAELTKWHKLAGTKDRLTEEDIIPMAVPDNKSFENGNANYPEWQKLIPTEAGALPSFTLNANYLLTMQTLNDTPLTYTFGTDKNKPVVARANDNLYVIMPIKS